MIVLYDIPSALPGKVWNPNVSKTRMSLNFKGIPFKTQWIEYPDIEYHSKKIGAPPTSTKPDGSPLYTVPFIHDLATGAVVADSFLIAEYLDKTYPDTGKLLPNGTAGLQSAFNDGLLVNLPTLLGLTYEKMAAHLSAPTVAHAMPTLERTRCKDPVGDWNKLRDDLGRISVWYARNEGGSGAYIFGESPSWADIVVAACLLYTRRALGEGSDEWREICLWNNGRWKLVVDAFREYEGFEYDVE